MFVPHTAIEKPDQSVGRFRHGPAALPVIRTGHELKGENTDEKRNRCSAGLPAAVFLLRRRVFRAEKISPLSLDIPAVRQYYTTRPALRPASAVSVPDRSVSCPRVFPGEERIMKVDMKVRIRHD